MPKFEAAKARVRDFYDVEGTCWVETSIEEQSKSFNGGSGAMPVTDFPLFNVGDTVTLKIDGVKHTLTAVDAEGTPTLGDRGLIGDPVVYNWSIYCEGSTVFFYTANSCTLSWYVKKEKVHRLDEKFMPLLTDTNGVKYKLTVSTDGTLSAVAVTEV